MINVYDMRMDSTGAWIRFFTKGVLVPPFDTRDQGAFFIAHSRIAIDRNIESTPRGSKAKFADYSNLDYGGWPIFSEQAKRILGPYLDGLGRWIELESDEAPYWLFWITNVVDALDEGQSDIRRFDDGGVMRIAEYAFDPEKVRDQFLFVLPQRRGAANCVTDTLVDVVREHRLTGFCFQRLWSSDTGPVSGKLKDWEKPRITGLEPR